MNPSASPEPATSEGTLPRVAQSEAELLNLTRALLTPSKRYIPALRLRGDRGAPIERIGPTAMGLLQQTLARGVCYELLRRGGWQQRRTLVEGAPRSGRLWERHLELPPLRFGRASFELLVWLREQDVGHPRRKLPYRKDRSWGDELLHYLAAEQIVLAEGNLQQPAFTRSPLCQLGFVHALVSNEPLEPLDYGELVAGEGALLLEALQPDLRAKWMAMERRKGSIVNLSSMRALGRGQDQVLSSLFGAIERGDPPRRELADFIAELALELLARGSERRCPDARWWIHSLDLRAALSERQAAFTAAAAWLRGVEQLGRWYEQAGLVAHFDEDYEAAQLLLAQWAPLRATPSLDARATPVVSAHDPHSSVFERARTLRAQLESLHSLGA